MYPPTDIKDAMICVVPGDKLLSCDPLVAVSLPLAKYHLLIGSVGRRDVRLQEVQKRPIGGQMDWPGDNGLKGEGPNMLGIAGGGGGWGWICLLAEIFSSGLLSTNYARFLSKLYLIFNYLFLVII